MIFSVVYEKDILSYQLSHHYFSGDAATIKDKNGNTTYSGINILKVESLGNFAQPGQVT